MHTTKTKSKTLNSPNMMPSFPCPLPVQCGLWATSGSSAPAPHDCPTSEVFSPRTVLTENICSCVQQILQHCPASVPYLTTSTKPFFLPGFSSSPDWLLVTRTRGAWWCRYRGHCRSGPRHLSPRSRVCEQEWHCKGIHSHIHSHPSMHTTKTKSKTLNSPNMVPSFPCPLPVQCGWWATGRKLGTSSSWLPNVWGLLA